MQTQGLMNTTGELSNIIVLRLSEGCHPTRQFNDTSKVTVSAG